MEERKREERWEVGNGGERERGRAVWSIFDAKNGQAWQRGEGEMVVVWRLIAVSAGVVAAFFASRKAWSKMMESQGQGSAVDMIIKGASAFQDHIGPWSVHDLTLGLLAMAKVAEKEPPPLPGKLEEKLSKDAEFLARAQHWRAMAEAVYVCEVASFSLLTHLPESALIHAEWNPDQSSLRPAYAVCIDAPYGAVVLSVRGTSHLIDILVDSGASPEDFRGGKAHAGYAHAVEVLLKEVEPHLKKAFEHAKKADKERGCEMKLVLVGHSMGGSIAIMCGLALRESYPGIECWSYSTPAAVSLDLAEECAEFATSFVGAYDVVPRFSLAAIEGLRQELENFDWENARRILKDDPDWKNIEKAMKTFKGMQAKAGEAVDGAKQQMGMDESGKEGKEEQPPPPPQEDEEKKQTPPGLFPPGHLLVLAADPPGCGKMPENRSNVPKQRDYGAYPSFEESLKTKWSLREAKPEEFLKLLVTPWAVSDHMLGNLCEGLGYLQSHCPPLSLSSS